MFKEIRIENFKAFGEPQFIPLAPLTLIYGPNSAGKSSIIQAIMLMHQSTQSASITNNRVLFNGEDVELGTFTSALFKHEDERKMKFGLSFAPTRRRYPYEVFRPSMVRKLDFTLELTPQARKEKHHEAWITEVIYGGSKEPVKFVRAKPKAPTKTKAKTSKAAEEFEPIDAPAIFNFADTEAIHALLELMKETIPRNTRKSTELTKTQIDKIKDFGFVAQGLLPSRVDVSTFTYELVESLGLRDLLTPYSPVESIRREFLDEMQGISYLGPLRSPPARHYIISGADRNSVGTRGERMPQLMYRRKNDVLPRINKEFEKFGIPYKIEIQSHGLSHVIGDIVVLTLKDKHGTTVSPSDVGFGIGQLLPILVEGLVSSGKTICVEQPEIHLHPRLQGYIADFLIDTTVARAEMSSSLAPKSRPNPTKEQHGGNQWIVETHSEALMLRLQTNIKKGLIKAEAVSVLYVQPMDDGGSQVIRLRLDDDGEFIDEWPDGFFEESFQEIFQRRL